MSISGIESLAGLGGALGAGLPYGADATSPYSAAAVTGSPASLFGPQGAVASTGPMGPTGPNFADMVTNGIQGLEAMNDRTDRLAVGAATGDLGAIHDYTIAATETSVATQLTVALRNKAVEAFTEIMRMQV